MGSDRIDAHADEFGVASGELTLAPGEVAELGRTHRCEIFGMGEQYRPRVANPVMEANVTLGGFNFEVRSHIANLKTHCNTSMKLDLLITEFYA